MGHCAREVLRFAPRSLAAPKRGTAFVLVFALALAFLGALGAVPLQQAQAYQLVDNSTYDASVAQGETVYLSTDSQGRSVFPAAPSPDLEVQEVLAASSSNPCVTVSVQGASWWTDPYLSLQAVSPGTATITYQALLSDDTAYSGFFTVCVFEVNLGAKAFAADVDGYYILYKGAKAVKPQIKGVSGVKWSSSNPAVAKVSSAGAISFKGLGSCVVTATFGDIEVVIPVECTYKKAYQAVKNGYADMAAKLTYSQPKRMQKKFRDCSSFVSRCYWDSSLKRKLYAIGGTSGKSWSLPAANQAQWLNNQKKTVAKKAVDPSKLLAGDTVYNTTGYAGINKRYLSIDHAMLYVGNGMMLTTGGWSEVGGTVGLRWYSADNPSIKLIARPCAEPQLNLTKATLTKKKGKAHSVQLKMQWQKGKVKWRSSNKKVATVNSKGKVTAKKKGKATISAKVAGKTYKCKVTVK